MAPSFAKTLAMPVRDTLPFLIALSHAYEPGGLTDTKTYNLTTQFVDPYSQKEGKVSSVPTRSNIRDLQT